MKLTGKRVWLLGVAAMMAGVGLGVGGCGDVQNSMGHEKPFVATTVPADFAVVLDETADSYYARQDIRQVVTGADLMSRTTYTTHRDYNNTLGGQYTQDHPMNQGQIQAMWNEVTKYDLMAGAHVWYYWETNPDNYRRTERVMQIRANGKTATYKQLNHWNYKLRDLALLVDAVRFPVAGGAGVKVVGEEPASTQAVEIQPAKEAVLVPASQPAAAPSVTGSAVMVPTTLPRTAAGSTQP